MFLTLCIIFHLFSFGHVAHNMKSLESASDFATPILSLGHCDVNIKHRNCNPSTLDKKHLDPEMLLIIASLGSHLSQSHLPFSHNKQVVEIKLVPMVLMIL